jgi:ATP-dependent DNA ligase
MRFPEWVVPMAATLTDERFTGPEWTFERKYDGIRLLAFRKGNSVRLLSRNQLPQSYPAVAGAIGGLTVDQVILDGEVDWGDGEVEYHVFDILWLNGRDLMPLPLMERRATLHDIGLRRPLHPVPEITGDKTMGAGSSRRMGRRDRQTSRFAVRAPPVSALAKDEMRGIAGTGGRRLH